MRKLSALTLAAFIAGACDGVSGPDSATTDALFDVTAQGAPTSTVLVKLRCGHDIRGTVDVQVFNPSNQIVTLACKGTVGESEEILTFGSPPSQYQLDSGWPSNTGVGSIPYDIYVFQGSQVFCGSWANRTGTPGETAKCFVGTESKGKTWFVVQTRYIK
jgi:hypothetical protein